MVRKANSELTRKLVELVAEDLSNGIEPNMKEIAKTAGISPSLINHHFSGRASLISLAWREVILRHVEDDFEHLDQLGEKGDWEGVAKFIYEVFSPERHESRLVHIRGIAEALGDPEVRAAVLEGQRRTQESWVRFLQKYRDLKVVEPRVDLGSMAMLFAAIPLGTTASKLTLTPEERQRMAETWMKIVEMTLKP